jgi:ATP-dependent Clp protease protease subunit
MTRRPIMRAPAAVIRLEGEIAPGAAGQMQDALAELSGQPVHLIINSPGGIATEGAAMMAVIEAHGNVTGFGRGVVASAATLPLLACARAYLHHAAAYMIHDPAALAGGPPDALRKAADDLDDIADIYAAAYARRTGLAMAQVRDWMRAETWLSADEAKALKFVDEIETAEPAPAVARADLLKLYTSTPAALLAAIEGKTDA